MGRDNWGDPDAPDWDEEGSWDDDLDKDEDDDNNTVACPHCRRQIHEEAEQCPYCEQYITEEGPVTHTKPWWVIVTALVLLYVMARSLAGGW